MNFRHRSYQKELLDLPDISFAAIAKNMQELDVINSYLGGHAITLEGVKQFHYNKPEKKELIICEIGCGGGDNLRVINKWCESNNIRLHGIGIDINPECIAYAKKHTPLPNVEWIISNYRKVQFKQQPDIIFNSLFCHHFNDAEMVEMLQWMKTESTLGFFINDLHRHPLAYYSIKWLTHIFSRSYLVKHDAPVSVTRGFKRDELEKYLFQSGIYHYKLWWKWAFRWLLIYQNNEES